MKKLNIAKTLGVIGICGFIFGILSFLITEAEEWAGIVLGLSIPFVFLYPLSKTRIDNEKEKEKIQIESMLEVEKINANNFATKVAISNVSVNPNILERHDPFNSTIFSSDSTLDNK